MSRVILVLIAALLFLGMVRETYAYTRLPHTRCVTARSLGESKLSAQYKGFDDMLANIEVPVLVDFYAEWFGRAFLYLKYDSLLI